ncbi:thioredoxin domain-containing protein [Flavilitoribacter nigricans]|uniref:Thioredoxin domain-containing protein n=1 Tax=Flavilitoribacter nigricans (strain ATCC 23147 / DSM 23189 / NBRC 102662 / NCIMB 1420 / SS-2) TaxID=1122177 RepID=A0A2D0N0K5_FLAN2|nr:thioredoxin domain-containing protein [Flavilitoribacter nigricans]PHN02044.1 thioredoxin domain-containing protein [Flavilitoribacter nigricans DSM 23189 = NBRC 102662]
MNRLQHETSPYLLQHAHNPVDWYAWKPEAFERARKEDKPILVSIGYSTCHWCHVMERESFENEAVAAFMNEHFINIKVDREERPDVDQIYMEACQAISGSGGWPLNCFLLPDGRPFFAGTYYPPRPMGNRPSWSRLLEYMIHNFREEREKVEAQAEQLTDSIRRSDELFLRAPQGKEAAVAVDRNYLQALYRQMAQQFDRTYGGFGGAPKFPGSMGLKYLLRHHFYFDTPEALQHVQLSLDKMIGGGIYDQLGGGFARYATDQAWLVPHFEKMLYDNALLVDLLVDAYQVTGAERYRRAITETLGFIQREMTAPGGGFYSALDADSEGVEGKFYVWEKSEIETILGDEAALFCAFYDVSEGGNWEGHNILWRPYDEKAFSARHNMALPDLQESLKRSRELLLAARSHRVRPGLDDKIILSWNALQIKAYARAAAVLGEEQYKREAVNNLHFLWEHFLQEDGEGFYHVYKEGHRQYDAFLDDYAFMIDALLAVYRLTFEAEYLEKAAELTDWVVTQFLDEEHKLFYFTSRKQSDLILRRKDLYDSATPSGNSVMLANLLQLSILFDRNDWREIAEEMLRKVQDTVGKYPTSFANWAASLSATVFPPLEIAVLGREAETTIRKLREHYLPGSIIMLSETQNDTFPLLRGKSVTDDTKIYLCQNYSCQLPVSNIEALMTQIEKTK